MLGDNRDHCKDSRFWGTVRLAEIKGPAFILYWSWDFNGSWGELLNPLTLLDLITSKTRWDRIETRWSSWTGRCRSSHRRLVMSRNEASKA